MNVFAEWTKVSESIDGDMTIFVDELSLRRNGNKIAFWALLNWKNIRKIDNDMYLSSLEHREYDCKNEQQRLFDYYLYSENMRSGKIVYSNSNIVDEFKSIVPSTYEQPLFQFICGKRK